MSSTLIANRIAKADRYANFLVEHLGSLATPKNVASLTGADWKRISNLMGENIPSRDTVALIVNNLRLRADTSDPFDGING